MKFIDLPVECQLMVKEKLEELCLADARKRHAWVLRELLASLKVTQPFGWLKWPGVYEVLTRNFNSCERVGGQWIQSYRGHFSEVVVARSFQINWKCNRTPKCKCRGCAEYRNGLQIHFD